MTGTLPESVDVWRMVSARRSFQGNLPVASLRRLCEALADTCGTVQFTLDFGRDGLQASYVDVRAEVSLTMLCQRTLEPFTLPVTVSTRLGLIRQESEEAGLPPDCEPLLVRADGRLNPADVVEDELLLALPLVAINPDSSLPDVVTPPDVAGDDDRTSPFAMLRELKSE